MSCNSPLTVYQVYDYYGHFVKNFFYRHDDVLYPYPEKYREYLQRCYDRQYTIYETVLPCGRCMGCRIDNAREYTVRMCLEAQMYPPDHCWDITLTYDDEHVPMNTVSVECDSDTGEVLSSEGVLTLCYRDVKLFLMRLRKKLGESFRYSYVGEYGDDTRRPHYHLIIFGISQDVIDPRFFKQSRSGFPIYISEFLASCWSNGFVSVQRVEYGSLAYVAGYVTKKMIGKDSQSGLTWYEANGLEPERRLSSNRPGIGLPWWNSLSDDEKARYIGVNQIHVRRGLKDVISIPVPRYFLRHYNEEHPRFLDNNFCMNYVKNQEKFDYSVLLACEQSDKTYLEILEDRESILVNNNKRKRRNVQ